MSAKRKTAANVFALMVTEYEYLTTQIGLKCIGIAGDAAGDERKARLDMLREHPNLLIADCWAHQICLILGDYVRANPKIAEVIDSAVEVVKWFNNHSYALGIFQKEQRETYGGKEWCLIMPVITRWTAYFASFDRLLKLRKALQVTAIKHEQELISALGTSAPARKKLKARRVLARIKDDSWWKKLVVIKTHFEPLAIAINVTQGANSRCDQVSFLLAKLYHSYSNLRQADCDHPESSMTEEEHPVTSILESIEKRWRKADQDLHIAAFFLNPFINNQLLDSDVIPISMMMGILRRLYMRVFEAEEVPSDFMISVYHYGEREGIFSKDAWNIEQLRKPLAEQDGTTDPIIMWKLLPKKNPLARLAILILSFVPNSTNTERLFTTVTDTKSKKRNRLRTEKLRKIVFVKLELRRQQAVEGTARARLKRHFGNDSTGAVTTPFISDESGSRIEEEDIVQAIEEGGAESETDEEDMAGTTADLRNDTGVPSETPASAADMSARSFVVVAREWEEQASMEDQDVDDTELDERGIKVTEHVTYGAGTPCRVRLYFGQPKLFDIAELFNFSMETGWDEFWFQGVKKYEEEALFYELLTSLDDREDKEIVSVTAPLPHIELPMVHHILVASYTDAVYTLAFDPVQPSLTLVSSTTVGHHPSWITPHPTDSSVVFTGLEQADGRVVVLKYDAAGKGVVIGAISSGGKDPAALLASKDTLFVGNYSSGTILTTPLLPTPPYVSNSRSALGQFTGAGPNDERQEASHPHQVVLIPEREELLVPDLGADRTWRFKRDNEEHDWTMVGSVLYEPGDGPRHVAFKGALPARVSLIFSSHGRSRRHPVHALRAHEP
ncbi:hypothetical protein EWM64_g4889, partial [Hericium alpestre]